MSEIENLMRMEARERRVAQELERRAEAHWKNANRLMSEIRDLAMKKESTCSEQVDSLG